MLRIVPHTIPRVGRSCEHFLDGFEIHLLTDWFTGRDCRLLHHPLDSEGGVPREQKMLKGHLTRVIYHQVYQYAKIKFIEHPPK